MATELSHLSIAEAAGLIESRQLSPVELTEAVLERIDELDGTLRSYILVTGDEARAAAKAAEREIAEGSYRGPLHGIPIGLKDLYEMAGVPTTAGSKFYRETPLADAPSVARLREAGAVFTGKLNLHEFAFGSDNVNPFHGTCRNPWDLDRVAGGSSGGSGAALAAGLCLGATGSDTGGSIRMPAAICGVVGFKPTRGLVSTRGLTPLSWSLDHAGPMARTVRDAALMLDVMAGFDAADPQSVSREPDRYDTGLREHLRGLTIGVPENYFFDGAEPDVEAAVRTAIAKLADLGAEILPVQLDLSAAEEFTVDVPAESKVPRLSGFAGIWLIICCVEAYVFHKQFLPEHRGDYEPRTLALIELAADAPATTYVEAVRARERLSLEFERLLREDIDLLATPTCRKTAPTIESIGKVESGLGLNTWVFNLTSQPTISVPCGFDSRGLPIGLSLTGAKWTDGQVLAGAHAYEQATDWHNRKPDLSAVEAAPG